MRMRAPEWWVAINSAHLNKFPRESCYWVSFRVISTKKGNYLLNEFLLSYIKDVVHVAALFRPLPAHLIDHEPISLPYLLPVNMLSQEELRYLFEKSIREIRVRLSTLSLSVREMIDVLRGKSDSFRRSAAKADLRVALQLLTKRFGLEEGFDIGERVYLAYSFMKEGEIFVVDTGERDRAFEILIERYVDIKGVLEGIFKGRGRFE